MLRLSSRGTSTLATSFFQVLANASGGLQLGESRKPLAIQLCTTSMDTLIEWRSISSSFRPLGFVSMQGARCPRMLLPPGPLFHGVSEYPDASWLDLISSARLCQNYVLPSSLPLALHNSPSHPVARRCSSYAVEPRWCLTDAPVAMALYSLVGHRNLCLQFAYRDGQVDRFRQLRRYGASVHSSIM